MESSPANPPEEHRPTRIRRILGAAAFPALLVGLVLGMSELPEFGDPASPASTHVSPRFIEDAAAETGALNMVTAVLADYRGYDTLGETAVIFAAGLGCLVILASAGPRPDLPAAGMSHPFGSVILDAVARILVPVVLLFAVYVLVHGHVSPGGGFQGGVLFGSGLIMMRLVWGPEDKDRRVPAFGPSLRGSLILACAGILGYVGIGLAAMAFGGEFLNYGTLPLGGDPAHVRELATLGIEAAVFLTVAGTVVMLFDTISIGIREDGVPLPPGEGSPE